MNILILNWRDIKNPKGGGAEVLTHEMAKRWVHDGHHVTQFSESFSGASREDMVDGIKIIRRGSADIRSFGIPVHVAAMFWCLRQKKGNFDVVIDEIHGIPFFTPWYIYGKKVALICEVADKLWNAAFSFPANVIGPLIEKNYFRFYKNLPFLTISPSTRKELLKMGIEKKNITVLPMGLSLPKRVKEYPKEKNLTLIFVARLTKAKGIEDAIKVAGYVQEFLPTVSLWVVGQGSLEYTRKVIDMVDTLKLKGHVKFFGFVGQDLKFELMSRASLLIAPSVKEGWGLTVPEAGFVGTPAVGYDVEGLRDVIVHEKTGLLVHADPSEMGKAVIRLIQDKKTYRKLQKGAHQLAMTYSWDKTAEKALSVLKRN